MKPFLHDDFFLESAAARWLYHGIAAKQPIIDYHTHLSPERLATNRRFDNLFELWLAGDHYKWRAMRANGVDEAEITGDATDYQKFLAYARTVPYTVRNPLYHWTHLELKRCFGIDTLLSEETAQRIWEEANEKLADAALSPYGLLRRFDVQLVATTDDPADALTAHKACAMNGCPARIIPTYRADDCLRCNLPDRFKSFIGRLESSTEKTITTLDALLDALAERHHFFAQAGSMITDNALEYCPFVDDRRRATRAFGAALNGAVPQQADRDAFTTTILLHLGRLNARRNWVMQLHLGALRDNRTRLYNRLGADCGADSIGDAPQARSLAAFLDCLDQEGALPKTILYNSNPGDFYLFGAMIGNFQDGSSPGKMQLGPGWWFLDNREGMECQLDALSHLGLLSRFVGMLTDARSFLSFPRHEYFRRLLCNLIGKDVDAGLIPADDGLLAELVRAICCENAKRHLGVEATI